MYCVYTSTQLYLHIVLYNMYTFLNRFLSLLKFNNSLLVNFKSFNRISLFKLFGLSGISDNIYLKRRNGTTCSTN